MVHLGFITGAVCSPWGWICIIGWAGVCAGFVIGAAFAGSRVVVDRNDRGAGRPPATGPGPRPSVVPDGRARWRRRVGNNNYVVPRPSRRPDADLRASARGRGAGRDRNGRAFRRRKEV